MPRRNIHCIAWIVPWCLFIAVSPAVAQTSPGASPTTAPADFKGITADRTYTPLPIVDSAGVAATQPAIRVGPISEQLRRDYRLNPFYTKTLTIDGIPIIGSDKVCDYAFLECAYTLDHMLMNSPRAVRDALISSRVRMGIIAAVEYTMDIPENQTRRNMAPLQAAFQDRRSRGLGGLPLATCAEENLLNLRSDPYTAENITIHEFSHTVASSMGRVDRAWYDHLRDIYNQAMSEGLFASSYSATNEQEYWAEGAQAWFDCAAQRKDATVHSGIWNRDQLKAYDPRLAKLLADIYGDGPWRYVKTNGRALRVGDAILTRTAEEMAHLAGLNRDLIPAFSFENSPRVQAVRRAETQPATQP
jgi:hypothetical protein